MYRKISYITTAILCFCFVFICQANTLFFPKQSVILGYYNSGFIGADPWRPPSPLFWKSSTKATSGGTLVYLRQLFHTQKYFSINWGISSGYFEHVNSDIFTLSALLEFRWWVFRTHWLSPYLVYSVAGPTLLSNTHFGPAKLSANFIFQDYLGAGIQFQTRYPLDVSLRMYHYSNGDLFTHNAGFDVPLLLFIGMRC